MARVETLRPLPSRASFRTMPTQIRKLIAFFLMLWLPLFSMSAAAMVSCPHGADSAVMNEGPMDSGCAMHHMDSDQPAAHHAAHSGHSAPVHDCGQCGVCHIACSPGLISTSQQLNFNSISSDSVALSSRFLSIILPIFEPPPLTRI